MADDRKLDVSRGEADVALRAGSRPEGGGIVAQRLPDSSWAAYCSRTYAAEHGMPSVGDALRGHALVLVEGATAKLPTFLWLVRAGANAAVSARASGLTNLVSTVKAGLGIGMMPCFVGDGEPDLVRCLPVPRELDAEVWLIVREEVKQAPHVRAFVDGLSAHMFALRREFAGETVEAAS